MARLFYHYPNLFWFCCCALVSATTTVIMIRRVKNFLYYDGVVKKFSIMQLEFPANTSSIATLVSQIRALPNGGDIRSLKALHVQLCIDFAYMAGTYTGIYFLTRLATPSLSNLFYPVLILLGKLQFLTRLFDILENVYLLMHLKRPFKMHTIGFIL